MKYYSIILVLIAGLVVSITSCDKKTVDPFVESVMKIDSITYPDTVQFNSPLPIKFYGVLGNGCNYFSRLEEQVLTESDSANTFRLKVYKKTEQGVSCTEEIKYLNETLNVTGMMKGNFYIKIVQPDESVLQGVVYVE